MVYQWYACQWCLALFIVGLCLVCIRHPSSCMSISGHYPLVSFSNGWDTQYTHTCTPYTGKSDTIPRVTSDTPWAWHDMGHDIEHDMTWHDMGCWRLWVFILCNIEFEQSFTVLDMSKQSVFLASIMIMSFCIRVKWEFLVYL